MTTPSYEELLQPTLNALRQLGGAQTIDAINSRVVESLSLTPEEIAQPHTGTKQTEIEYRLAWARTYLKIYGLIDNPKRGAWILTELGQETEAVNPKTVSAFVHEQMRQGKVDSEEPSDEIGEHIAIDLAERLAQWRLEATDTTHPNYYHADLDRAIRVYARISTLLQKLRTTPDEFSRDDIVAMFGALNSGQRQKNKVADMNPLPLVRQALLALIDGPGSGADKIATAAQTLKFAGANTLGELYGWANAQTVPLYNGCATAALHHLGYSFNDKDYPAFLAAHEQFRQIYEEQVGHLRPELPLNLEIDKFYNVIDKVDLKRENRQNLAQPSRGMFANGEEAGASGEIDQSINEAESLEFRPDQQLASTVVDAPFNMRVFELLQGIRTTPTKAFYLAHKEEFKQFIEEPFQRIFRQVAERIPVQIRVMMETDTHVFARFLKNDWGQGGAWDFYWGAFYPKGGKRTEDAQLSMWMDHEWLEFGFFIGAYASEQRQRFQRNCQTFGKTLLPYLLDALPESVVHFGRRDNFEITADSSIHARVSFTWNEFLDDPAQAENDVSVIIPRRELLRFPEDQLVTKIVDTYRKIFPLVLLAVEDDPLPVIARYLQAVGLGEDDAVAEPPEIYDQSSFLSRTYLGTEQAADLFDLLQDKKQIILYGPPGTGKTYVAQELAKWVTGIAHPPADRMEIVQFHPAYSYEDFIEGIRPESKSTGDGHFIVDYPPRPGVFRRFCKVAQANPDQPHVFIIDEINRGNLPRIFGELMLLLEYRDRDVPLPYSGERFRIPPNVFLIGTMNTADRSIALVDFALRRRFHFFQFSADPDLLERWLEKHPLPIPYLATLYRRLSQDAIDDPDYAVGVSYFMDTDLTEAKLARIWRRSIVPYLAEYYVEQRARVKNWEWESEFMAGIRGKV